MLSAIKLPDCFQDNTTEKMENQLKYFTGLALGLPLSPILLWQGRKVRQLVPEPIEPTDIAGVCGEEHSKQLTLWVLGESTMAGVGVSSHQEGFAGSLARIIAQKNEIQVQWNVLAKSGYTALDVDRNLVSAIQPTKNDLVVLGLGGNDSFALNSPSKWRKDMEQLILSIRQKMPHSPIVFASLPPIMDFPAFTPLMRFFLGELVQILGKELAELVEKHEQVYFDDRVVRLADWREEAADMSELFSDGVHPSAKSYQIWARELATFISQQKSIGDIFGEK